METVGVFNSGLGRQLPPRPDHVMIWFLQQGSTEAMAQDFFEHFDSKGWTGSNGELIRDWKMVAWHWFWKNK